MSKLFKKILEINHIDDFDNTAIDTEKIIINIQYFNEKNTDFFNNLPVSLQ